MQELNTSRHERRRQCFDNYKKGHNPNSNVFTGVFILIVGALAMAKSYGVLLPTWLFTWQMLLIGIGVLIGLKRNFRDGGWFVPIIVGTVFLLNDYFYFGNLRRHVWPLVLICVGLFIVLKAGKKKFFPAAASDTGDGIQPLLSPDAASYTQDDIIDSTCIFSGTKKVILSKNFRGGDMVAIFGGCEIDLTQADITAPAILEVTAIFGGATLIVPSNWALKSEAVTIFGGINDKRKIMTQTEAPTKTLVLKGTMIFGGMEIRSY